MNLQSKTINIFIPKTYLQELNIGILLQKKEVINDT